MLHGTVYLQKIKIKNKSKFKQKTPINRYTYALWHFGQSTARFSVTMYILRKNLYNFNYKSI